LTSLAGHKSSRFDAPPADKLRTARFFSTDPSRRDSPSPPSYPSHLSPQRTSRAPIPMPQPEVVRPVPVRPRDDSARRAQTLTLAQAANLAAGLGDARLADELRSSGLSGRDKVTSLPERVGERVEESRRALDERERRTSGKAKVGKESRRGGADEELKLRRRQGDERGGSSSSSVRHGPSASAKDALLSSIFKVRPPVVAVDENVPLAAAGGSGKASRRRRDRDEPYRSPTTGSAARASSHFDLPTRSTGGGSYSYDFDDNAWR